MDNMNRLDALKSLYSIQYNSNSTSTSIFERIAKSLHALSNSSEWESLCKNVTWTKEELALRLRLLEHIIQPYWRLV